LSQLKERIFIFIAFESQLASQFEVEVNLKLK